MKVAQSLLLGLNGEWCQCSKNVVLTERRYSGLCVYSVCSASKGWLHLVEQVQEGNRKPKKFKGEETHFSRRKCQDCFTQLFIVRQKEQEKTKASERIYREIHRSTVKRTYTSISALKHYTIISPGWLLVHLSNMSSSPCGTCCPVSWCPEGFTVTVMVGICSFITLLCHHLWQIIWTTKVGYTTTHWALEHNLIDFYLV